MQLHEVPGQQVDVAATLVEPGQMQIDHIEPVVQIFAKFAARNRRFQILVGGSDDAHVDAVHFACADRPHLLVFDDAQKLDLQRQRHIANLVEKQGAVIRLADQALARRDRTGVRALDVAEQFGLHQFGRYRAAVHRH